MADIILMGRARFLALWTPKAGMMNEDGKVGASKFRLSLIIDKESPDFKVAYDAMCASAQELWKANWQNVVTSIERSKKFLRDGNMILRKDGSPYPEMVNKIVIATSTITRPNVYDVDGRTPLGQSDGRPYDGCYVRIICDPYAYYKQGQGNSIPCTLRGVQFVKDGDAFGPAPTAPGVFSDLSATMSDTPPPAANGAGSLF